MKQLEKNFNFDVILYFAVMVTLALTPMFNSDSLIIPKLVLLSALGMFMLPKVLENYKYIYHDILKSKNLHSRKTKYHIAYLGNSIAERYAYFTEHMRLQIISSCFDEYEMLSNTTTTSLPLNQLQQINHTSHQSSNS